MTHTWDPDRYLAYADERGRPFVDLITRIGAADPATVVDLGCGPGNLTALLAERWPDAAVSGVDSSAEMITAARASGAAATFEVGDVRDWGLDTPSPSGSGYSTGGEDGVDVLVSNATLQWLPDHLELLPRLVAQVRPGGWLAFQVPGNFDEPSHTLRTELAAESPYADHTAGAAVPSSYDAATYLRALQELGCDVDAWETTYLHVLHGKDPVFTWVSGTGARPTLQALPDALRPRFEAEFKRRLRDAYPDHGHGVVLPFRRIFVVARVPAGPTSGGPA
ncbi:methyltransferase domain-containing protein [Nocardioides bizhenqiangii]|uniref:Trans-aconitate 2-methyltransferase n=1 Tax=Nocardioides bizhenqiangii TaxID=3095076 RepID=A0ABZ0ZSB6_9ACTN|nr:methyltransferase domain-containing protein [Nocardioides sp. HM61]WQQ27206.1 methyltransferase domain-containing protein [Nocardioides sp. HM61]